MQPPRETISRYEWATLYKAQPALPRTPETAAAVVAEIKAAANGSDGTALPQAVVDRARDPNNLLHGFFTWDDDQAAEKWRIEQARDLIRGMRTVSITVLPDNRAIRQQAVPVFASVRVDDKRRSYREVTVLATSEAGRQALLREAMEQLAGFRRRYAALAELAEVMRAIDRILMEREAVVD